jgi:hypothetical protein
MARDRQYSDISTEHRIYACLVLAKAGELSQKLFNYLSEINTAELPRYSTYQLASALALSGDVARAKEIVPFDIQPDLSPPETGGNFSSGVRSDAILLDLMIEIDPDNPSAAVLAQSLLRRARLNRWYNTQATSFALMALGKYFKGKGPADFTGEIQIAGGEDVAIDTAEVVLTDRALGGREVTISIDGRGPCYYYWQASGVPTVAPELEYNRGITVRREYLDSAGEAVDLSGIPLGTRMVGHISITSDDRKLENVVIADLLPAGLEIENPRLAATPTMSWLPSKAAQPEYQDIRDDRLLLFVDLPEKKTLNFYYGARTISQGEFAVPPVSAECMYNPLVAGAGSSGRMTVTAFED